LGSPFKTLHPNQLRTCSNHGCAIGERDVFKLLDHYGVSTPTPERGCVHDQQVEDIGVCSLPCARTPKDGGQLAGLVGCSVRYVFPPESFKSVVPAMLKGVDPAGRRGCGGRWHVGSGNGTNLEDRLILVATKFGRRG